MRVKTAPVLEPLLQSPKLPLYALQLQQYILHDAEYALLLKLKAGDISSEVVTGFTIPVAAIFDRKLKNQVLTQLLNR